MRQKSVHPESPSERIVKNIRRATRKRYSSEEKIRIVLDGLRGRAALVFAVSESGNANPIAFPFRLSITAVELQ
jgi:transposase